MRASVFLARHRGSADALRKELSTLLCLSSCLGGSWAGAGPWSCGDGLGCRSS